MGKSGTNLAPKHAGKSSKSPIPSSKPKPTSSKLPTITPSTSSKVAPPYNPGKKKSTSFGVIWLPIGKRSKHKDYVYNAYKHNDRNKERAPSMYNVMSGDSNHHTLPKMDEESIKDKGPVVLGGVATATALDSELNETDDKSLEKPITEEDKDAAGDADSNRGSDLLINEGKSKGSVNDNVDSVFLRPPPAGKVRSTPSTQEEDSCGMKCLYYTLQCCDCVLM